MSSTVSWVKKFAASALAATLLAVPLVQAVTFGFPPDIVSSSVTPVTFNPANGSVNITWTMAASSPDHNIEVNILDSNFVVVHNDLIPKQPHTNVHQPVLWNGKINGVLAPAGTYYYEIIASNVNGTDFASGPFNLVTPAGTAPIIGTSTNNDTADFASPNPFDPNTQTTTVFYSLNTSSTVTVEFRNSSNALVDTVSGNQTQAVWDGRDSASNPFPEGTYTYTIVAMANGQTDTEDGTVVIDYVTTVNAPTIGTSTGNDTSDFASPNPFDPNTQSTTVFYTLNTTATVTVQFRNSSNTVVETVNGTQTQAVWDGRDSANNAFPEGTYTYTITATNSSGTNTEDGTVTVQYGVIGTQPQILQHFASPNPFDSDVENTNISFRTNLDADVTVEIFQGTTRIRTLLNDVLRTGNTLHSVSWDGEDLNGNQMADNTYTYRITACQVNNASNCDVENGTVRVETDGSTGNGNDDLISDVTVKNAVFDPSEGERSEVCFDIENDNTEISIDILDGNTVIRDLVENVEYDEDQDRCFSWNGRDDDGDMVDDDVYQYRVRAEHGNDTEVELAYTEVDTDGIIIGFPDDDEFCAGFRDVPKNSPFCKAIELMFFRGIFTGFPDGTFRPFVDINRAEATKVILLALDYGILSDDGSNLGFWDVVPRAWYMPYLRTARQYGIVRGYPDGSFRPGGPINRVELLKVFLEATDIIVPQCNVQPYADTPINAETRWYINYACFAKVYGLMTTDAAGNFRPDQPMTRADVANLFYQFEIRGLYDGYNTNYYNNFYNTFPGYGMTSGYGYGMPTYGYNYPIYTNPVYSPANPSGDLIIDVQVDDPRFDPQNGERTEVCFDIENDDTEISIDVLDDDNNVVRELVDNDQYNESNNRCFSWNGRDDNLNIVPDGDYSFRVRAEFDNDTQTEYADVEVL